MLDAMRHAVLVAASACAHLPMQVVRHLAVIGACAVSGCALEVVTLIH